MDEGRSVATVRSFRPFTMSDLKYLNSKKTAMRYNNLGASGLQVSELSFGCMTL